MENPSLHKISRPTSLTTFGERETRQLNPLKGRVIPTKLALTVYTRMPCWMYLRKLNRIFSNPLRASMLKDCTAASLLYISPQSPCPQIPKSSDINLGNSSVVLATSVEMATCFSSLRGVSWGSAQQQHKLEIELVFPLEATLLTFFEADKPLSACRRNVTCMEL